MQTYKVERYWTLKLCHPPKIGAVYEMKETAGEDPMTAMLGKPGTFTHTYCQVGGCLLLPSPLS